MADYKPGTLWKGRHFQTGEPMRVLKTLGGWYGAMGGNNTSIGLTDEGFTPTDLRPLIVLDPEELGLSRAFYDAYALRSPNQIKDAVWKAVHDQLAALDWEPLAEPDEVGSVVWDRRARPWMLIDDVDDERGWCHGVALIPWRILSSTWGPLSLERPGGDSA